MQNRDDSTLIDKDDKPVAALADAELLVRIRQMREQFGELCCRIALDFANVPEDEGMAEIDAAVARERGR